MFSYREVNAVFLEVDVSNTSPSLKGEFADGRQIWYMGIEPERGMSCPADMRNSRDMERLFCRRLANIDSRGEVLIYSRNIFSEMIIIADVSHA
jgi:hypothetical protein